MNQWQITDIAPEHYTDILTINQDNVEMLSALDERGLRDLLAMASLTRAVVAGGRTVAFMIALREHKAYQSVNYRWFCERLPHFLYIDRIAVAQNCRGQGLASRLYAEAAAWAHRSGVDVLAAEINVEPENRPSLLFHRRQGFAEIGRQVIDGGKKTVSMQTCPLQRSENCMTVSDR